jgi:hypothetical protein
MLTLFSVTGENSRKKSVEERAKASAHAGKVSFKRFIFPKRFLERLNFIPPFADCQSEMKN